MSLVYSGGPYRNDVYSVTTRQQLLTNINTTLTACGWSSQNVFAFTELVYNGNPAANQTITIAGQVYTFRTTVSTTANDVLIGATGTATAQNLVNAINLGPGSGTVYGSLTILNPNMSATDFRSFSASEGRFRLQTKINSTPFSQQGLLSVSSSASGYQFTHSSNILAGYIWTSPQTPQGQQQIKIYGIDALEENFPTNIQVRLYAMDENELYRSSEFVPASSPGGPGGGFRLQFNKISPVSWRIIASRYNLYIFIDGGGGPAGSGQAFCAGIPYIYPFLFGRSINNASNTNPIVITHDLPHGYTNGQTVFHRGIQGNTAANGTFTLTYLSPTTYSIPVAGNGSYLSGGISTRSSNDKCGMIFWAAGDDGNGGNSFLFNRFGAELCTSYQNFNGNGFFQSGQNGSGIISVLTVAPSRIQDAGTAMQFADGSRALLEPHIAISSTNLGKSRWAGQMYDTMLTLDTQTQGTIATVDSRNWYCLGPCTGSSSNAHGSVWVVIP